MTNGEVPHFDVIIVGAGPAGSAAALITARAGLKVLLIERGEYPGAKNVSGAVFYGSAILNDLIPNWWEQAPIERYVCRRELVMISPRLRYRLIFAPPPQAMSSRRSTGSPFSAPSSTAGSRRRPRRRERFS